MSNTMFYEQLSPLELKEIIDQNGIIYLPLGSLEWHNQHLPFGLDALVSYEICKRSCKITGGCVIPPLFFGTDREHNVNGKILHGMDAKAGKILPGSLYFIKQDLFLNLLRQIINNIREQGFRKIVIVSAHSGTAQQEMLEVLIREKINNVKILIFPGKKFIGGIDHAGPIETSLMLAINKDLVNLNRLQEPLGLGHDISVKDIKSVSQKDGLERLEKIIRQIIDSVKEL